MLKLPALDPATVEEKRGSGYPEPFKSRMGDRVKRRAIRSGGSPGEKLGDRSSLGRAQGRALSSHAERAQRIVDVFRRDRSERLAARHARHGSLVARGAMLLVERCAVRGQRLRGGDRRHAQDEDDGRNDDPHKGLLV